MKRLAVALLFFLMPAAPARAQTDAPRRVVFGDLGYSRTWDDEGLLGSGAALRGGVGFRLTPRLTLQAVVDRVPYHRDIEYLKVDGRVLYGGVELGFLSANPRVRPYITIGIGRFKDDGVWVFKHFTGPGSQREEEAIPRHYSAGMFTSSGGVEVRMSDRTSIRAGLRLHGLLNTGNDALPHTIIQPTIGVAYRW
jgi:outer membrane protein with beta-barrel domain